MTDRFGPRKDGATELDDEEREGLIPSYITLRHELNEAEQANILAAETWAFSRNRDLLSEQFLDTLHQRMFGQVWKWAGRHRTTGKNIGIEAFRIPTELRKLVDDVRYWVEYETYEPDELVARFHHRLVSIHCYPNGNGRHARLAADLLLRRLGRERFSWGGKSLTDIVETRKRYVAALQAADAHDIQPLLDFVRS